MIYKFWQKISSTNEYITYKYIIPTFKKPQKVDANLFTNPEYSWETESLTYADLVLGNIHKENHGGHRMTGTIKGGITFE